MKKVSILRILVVVSMVLASILFAKPTTSPNLGKGSHLEGITNAPLVKEKKQTFFPIDCSGTIGLIRDDYLLIVPKDPEGFAVRIEIDPSVTNGMIVAVLISQLQGTNEHGVNRRCLLFEIKSIPVGTTYLTMQSALYKVYNLPAVSINEIQFRDGLDGGILLPPRKDHEDEDLVLWLPSWKHFAIGDSVVCRIETRYVGFDDRRKTCGFRIQLNSTTQLFEEKNIPLVPDKEEIGPK